MLGEAFRGTGTPDPVALRVFALEAEFRVALAWTREYAPGLHTRVAAALGLVLNDSGRAGEAHAELGRVIERSGTADATGGWAAVLRAFTAIALGSKTEAPLIDEGLVAVRAADDVRRYQLALCVAGVYWLVAEEPERALKYSDEALALARDRPHPDDLALALIDHANILVELGRLDEAEALFNEAAPLLPQLGASAIDPAGMFDQLSAARGDWACASSLFLTNAQVVGRNQGLKGMLLRHTAIALAHLGADEDAIELAATADAICESIGEVPNDPLTTRYGHALNDARERIGADRAARAARRGAALPDSESLSRAGHMVHAASDPRPTWN